MKVVPGDDDSDDTADSGDEYGNKVLGNFKKNSKSKKVQNGSKSERGSQARTRPTNNQLLYKAYFRWTHDTIDISDCSGLPCETDACPSVTACFLQVLQTLHDAEQLRTTGAKRNVLQILSNNTRRTKVVELSTGTHRVPDELRKHYLSDGESGQYSTNLDRNRYGTDENYLFTVIRYDLEFLGLCPCLVDVEIVDAKAGNASMLVESGAQACMCGKPNHHAPHTQSRARHQVSISVPNIATVATMVNLNQQLQGIETLQPQRMNYPSAVPYQSIPTATSLLPSRGSGRDSPLPANSGGSGLFDALVMAATGGSGEMNSALPINVMAAHPNSGTNMAANIAYGGFSGFPSATNGSLIPALPTHHEQLLMGQSTFGQPVLATGAYGPAAAAAPSGFQPVRSGVAPNMVQPSRMHGPPHRNRSRLWSALSSGELDSLQNALDAYIKGHEEEIVSKPLNGEPVVPSPGPEAGPSSAVATNADSGFLDPASVRMRRRKPPRGNSSFLLRAVDSSGGFSGLSNLGFSLGFKENSDDNIEEVSVGAGPHTADSGGGEVEGELVRREGGGEAGADIKNEAEAEADDSPQEQAPSCLQQRRRARYVPRQCSAVNMTGRVAAAQIKTMAVEIDDLRKENQRLKRGVQAGAAGVRTSLPDTSMLFSLEQELLGLKAELESTRGHCKALEEKEAVARERADRAEVQSAILSAELAKCKAEVHILLSKLVTPSGRNSASSVHHGNLQTSASQQAITSTILDIHTSLQNNGKIPHYPGFALDLNGHLKDQVEGSQLAGGMHPCGSLSQSSVEMGVFSPCGGLKGISNDASYERSSVAYKGSAGHDCSVEQKRSPRGGGVHKRDVDKVQGFEEEKEDHLAKKKVAL
ncbi:hypothetical protein CEUSTIGMA_g673.t1 [Chlamydomonas eustigma]|uniref:Uncharacterized protein n=1 Tax=Chlamydomonas eustigma TaxID=1157962 RepID=A0A250WRP8_9CHLO|nr:hypothetical protein CEUSTIGMA_g673.t1 [Chlamydomonas eustigma]|eukprot:GAX73220.1 hypothetical protein CEUSTIGMA_g673.t1 [Chlamydomonas eustigma]